LESVCRGNSTVGSNPTLSATSYVFNNTRGWYRKSTSDRDVFSQKSVLFRGENLANVTVVIRTTSPEGKRGLHPATGRNDPEGPLYLRYCRPPRR
jgi:hypothetical protein